MSSSRMDIPKRVQIKQKHINNCDPNSQYGCAICLAIDEVSKDVYRRVPLDVVLGTVHYRASRKLVKWQQKCIDDRTSVKPITLKINHKRREIKCR